MWWALNYFDFCLKLLSMLVKFEENDEVRCLIFFIRLNPQLFFTGSQISFDGIFYCEFFEVLKNSIRLDSICKSFWVAISESPFQISILTLPIINHLTRLFLNLRIIMDLPHFSIFHRRSLLFTHPYHKIVLNFAIGMIIFRQILTF